MLALLCNNFPLTFLIISQNETKKKLNWTNKFIHKITMNGIFWSDFVL